MKTKAGKNIKIEFPINLYLKQLFCPDLYVRLINPWEFWRKYRRDHLEACWNFNIIQHLERCKQKKFQPSKQHYSHKSFDNKTAIYQAQNNTFQNQIFITQPSIKLKYRGVTYFANHTVAVDVKKINFIANSVNEHKSNKLPLTYKDNTV